MDNELIVTNPAELIRQSSDVAGVCKAVVLKTAVTISGKKYVRVEGWQAIAIAHGCILSARDVEKTDTGFRAIGEVRRASDGILLATAEGFVGDDEKTWEGRPEYAKRAMAQTRAMSRAARSAFAHVVVMMDAGLSTTPAEEVPAEGFSNGNVKPEKKKTVEQHLAEIPDDCQRELRNQKKSKKEVISIGQMFNWDWNEFRLANGLEVK